MSSVSQRLTLSADGSIRFHSDFLDRLGWSPGDRLIVAVEECAIRIEREPPQKSVQEGFDETAALIRRKNLETSLRYLRGVGPVLSRLLEKIGVRSIEDALYLLPHRYEDRRTVTPIQRLTPGSSALFTGTVLSAGAVTTRSGKRLFEVVVRDESGIITCKWFSPRTDYLSRIWKPGRRGIFNGTVTRFGSQIEVHHPDAEWLAEGETIEELMRRDPLTFGTFVPVYPLTEGLHQKRLRRVMRDIVDRFASSVENHLPQAFRERYGLMDLGEALSTQHFPTSPAQTAPDSSSLRTIVFDEFFFLELGLALRRRGIQQEPGIPFSVNHIYTKPLLEILPFSLTAAQRRVLSEIKADMMAPHPMHRLVQGDVGCGKTLVALMAALVAVENGYQVAIMAPTELLAEQHYLNIHTLCDQLGISTVLLTSSILGKERKRILSEISEGIISIVVGTHAVIQEKVEFFSLGLGIIDEQHRFGVIQRGALKRKGVNPDILVMTATPIPRTLAMTVFGDLAISIIDELPPGRKPVQTRVIFESRRPTAYQTLRQEVAKGRQGYVICPLVEESEKIDLPAAVSLHATFKNQIFPDFRVGLLHGRMKPDEKEVVMRSFKGREIDILVATTVIEVGIDVPNATVIMIEHADRFGLSQLHQLRGRVGRGEGESLCLLMASDSLSEEGMKRLRVMEKSMDGFAIAEADLELRGPGDFLGTRQAGLPDFRVGNILRDGMILEEARQAAFELVERDPELSLPDHLYLRRELRRRWGGRLELATIG